MSDLINADEAVTYKMGVHKAFADVLAGDEGNIKITTPTDLAVAEAILRQREAAL